MIPNIHIHEKLMFERHQEVLREMERRRELKDLPRHRFSMARKLAGKSGALLIVLGKSLKQLEPSKGPVV
jgi:hypothetical protein